VLMPETRELSRVRNGFVLILRWAVGAARISVYSCLPMWDENNCSVKVYRDTLNATLNADNVRK
jgi:hypothetical protein